MVDQFDRQDNQPFVFCPVKILIARKEELGQFGRIGPWRPVFQFIIGRKNDSPIGRILRDIFQRVEPGQCHIGIIIRNG